MNVFRAFLAISALTLATLIILPFHIICLYFFPKIAARIASFWHVMSSCSLGLRIHIMGKPYPGPALLLPNHLSWLDIVVLSRIQPLSFVSKAEVASWPIFSALAHWQRTVYVKREMRRETSHALDKIAHRLKSGDTLVLFAEGTSSDGWQVLPFKSALIGAAVTAASLLEENKTPIYVQPVAICYTHLHGLPLGRLEADKCAWFGDLDLVPHLLRQLKNGGLDVSVFFGTPVRVEKNTNRKVLAHKMETDVKCLLQALRTQN